MFCRDQDHQLNTRPPVTLEFHMNNEWFLSPGCPTRCTGHTCPKNPVIDDSKFKCNCMGLWMISLDLGSELWSHLATWWETHISSRPFSAVEVLLDVSVLRNPNLNTTNTESVVIVLPTCLNRGRHNPPSHPMHEFLWDPPSHSATRVLLNPMSSPDNCTLVNSLDICLQHQSFGAEIQLGCAMMSNSSISVYHPSTFWRTLPTHVPPLGKPHYFLCITSVEI